MKTMNSSAAPAPARSASPASSAPAAKGARYRLSDMTSPAARITASTIQSTQASIARRNIGGRPGRSGQERTGVVVGVERPQVLERFTDADELDRDAELAKVRRVIGKQIEGAPHETLLTVDATTGQNGLRQAKLFSEAVPVDGIVLTKLDGTAKGGIVVAVQRALGVPVKLVGLGEGPDDLAPFEPEAFVDALLS